MTPRSLRAAGFAAALALLLLPTGASAQAVPTPCPSAKSLNASIAAPASMTCGKVRVPLDHSGQTPGSLSLAYARVPAGSGRSRGTIVLLAGGPGQAAIPLAGSVTRFLGPVARDYDVVYVDQRGTGASDAVSCRSLDTFTQKAIARCAKALGSRRAFWTTQETALDLEDLRAALGLQTLTLLGVSYGTKVAGEYARRFPTRTAGVILDSPTPIDGLDTSLALRQLALPRVLREVCRTKSCARFLPAPSRATRQLARKLARQPLRASVVTPAGRQRTLALTESDLYGLLIISDVDPVVRAALPAAIASAVLGDGAPMLRVLTDLAGSQSAEAGNDNQARFLATSCLEGRLPWSPEAPLAGRATALARAFSGSPSLASPFEAGTVLRASIAAMCLPWPATPRPEPVAVAGPDRPVLVLSGRDDLRTPLEDARRTAGQYPQATVLSVPGVGHSVLSSDSSGCAIRGLTAFLAGRRVTACRRSAQVTLPTAPYVAATVLDLAPLRGIPGAAGRGARAVGETLRALRRAALLSGFTGRSNVTLRLRGLRGGVAMLSRRKVTLREYTLVRGVALSGTITERRAKLRVGGTAAIRGTLRRGRGKAYVGTLDGKRIVLRVDDLR